MPRAALKPIGKVNCFICGSLADVKQKKSRELHLFYVCDNCGSCGQNGKGNLTNRIQTEMQGGHVSDSKETVANNDGALPSDAGITPVREVKRAPKQPPKVATMSDDKKEPKAKKEPKPVTQDKPKKEGKTKKQSAHIGMFNIGDDDE